jgi:hypothetical protein
MPGIREDLGHSCVRNCRACRRKSDDLVGGGISDIEGRDVGRPTIMLRKRSMSEMAISQQLGH